MFTLPGKIIRILKHELFAYAEFIISHYPDSVLGNWLRGKYWPLRYKIGHKPLLAYGSHFSGKGLIEVGDNFQLGHYGAIEADDSDGIFIGHNVAIARGAHIRSANHRFESLDVPIIHQGHTCKTIEYRGRKYSVVIEDDVWIGSSCLILSGATIGRGSVIGAGSIVVGAIPPFSIAVGNPCRVIASRLGKEQKGDTGR